MNRTLEAIRAACTETHGCWLWRGALISGKCPQATFPDGGGKLVRRVAFELAGGRLLGSRYVLVSTCDQDTCCNPEHLQQVSKSRKLRDEYAEGTRRRRSAPPPPKRKLTAEQAQEVRDAEEPRAVVAERYGITASHVNRIRRGECWQRRLASVFDLAANVPATNRRVSADGCGRKVAPMVAGG